jgi:hypothetical protein
VVALEVAMQMLAMVAQEVAQGGKQHLLLLEQEHQDKAIMAVQVQPAMEVVAVVALVL